MHPVTHLLAGWTVASVSGLEKRDRAIVSIAGLAPDFDGAGIVVEWATRDTNTPFLRKGFSPLEIISKRADQLFVEAFRRRFGTPRPAYGE